MRPVQAVRSLRQGLVLLLWRTATMVAVLSFFAAALQDQREAASRTYCKSSQPPHRLRLPPTDFRVREVYRKNSRLAFPISTDLIPREHRSKFP